MARFKSGFSPPPAAASSAATQAPGGFGPERGFDQLAVLITEDGYWRPWGAHRRRTINLDGRFYWLHWNVCTIAERTVINRWTLTVEHEQLTIDEVAR